MAWLSCAIYIFSIFMLFALRWSRRTYPMDDAALVYFVLSSETGGVDSGTWRSILRNVVLPTAATVLFSFVVIALANIVLCTANRASASIDAYVLPYPMLNIWWSAVLLLYTALIMAVKLKAWRYLAIWYRVHKKSVYSAFYEEHYADPQRAVITFPSKKRNLIIIFMESMEATFGELGLLPNLSQIAKEDDAISFGAGGRAPLPASASLAPSYSMYDASSPNGESTLGGGLNLDGTSWTVAGIIAKLSGLPFFNPYKGHSNNRAALRQAVTLGDILQGEGYKCVFAMGSEKRFEERDAFLEPHGFEVHDIDWYKNNGMLEKDYQVFWGFEDAKLFSLAQKETAAMGATGTPFCFAMLTVDTHFPDGYRCPLCPKGEGRQIEDVVRCADNQVSAFVAWCKKQEWYRDTAVVIMGDHNYLGAPCNDFVRDAIKGKGIERRWLDLFINAAGAKRDSDRVFSSYDMFPTMLEAAGGRIAGGKLAFGRSLFQSGKTLAEELGPMALNDALMRHTVQYEKLKTVNRE